MCLTRRKRRDGKERRVHPGGEGRRVTGGGEAGADEEEREGKRSEADAHIGESTKLEHTFRIIQKTYSM